MIQSTKLEKTEFLGISFVITQISGFTKLKVRKLITIFAMLLCFWGPDWNGF